ncbi:MAG: hypothetical protein JSS72_05885 [Armatimonadetes bacterium]|nr:hypothetical protein [Armatimonadota bacterium]
MKLLFALMGLPGLLFGQQSPRLQHALESLRSHPAIFMRLQGNTTLGMETHSETIDLYWDATNMATSQTVRIKLTHFKDDVEQYRLIADGRTLYNLDIARNEYTAARYGDFGQGPPANLVDSVLQSVVSQSKGDAGFPARLLRDICNSSAARFTPCITGVDPIEEPNDVVYQDDPNTPHRTITYYLDPQTHELSSIDYYDSVPLGNSQRVTNWTTTIYTFVSAPANWNFDFVAPAGSRAIEAKGG